MKKLIRSFLYNLFSLWILSHLFISFTPNDFFTLVQASLVLTLLLVLLKPILNLLFLPINLITLGLLSWIPSIIIIYLLTLIVPNFDLLPITIRSFSVLHFNIPNIHLGWYSTLIFIGFCLFITKKVLRQLM